MVHNSFPHMIHRQVLEVILPPNIFPNEAEEKFKNIFYDALSEIENVFGDYDIPGRTIRIDKVVIDIGHLDYEKLDQLFSVKLTNALSKVFEQAGLVYKRSSSQPRSIQYSGDRSEQRPVYFDGEFFRGENNYEMGDRLDQTFEGSIVEAFFYFLQNGVLPWWMSKNNDGIEAVFTAVIDDSVHLSVENLASFLKRNKNALTRLLFQFSPQFQEKIIYLLRDRLTKDLVELVSLVPRVFIAMQGKLNELIKSDPVYTNNRLRFEILLAENFTTAFAIIIEYIKKTIADNHLIPIEYETLFARKPNDDLMQRILAELKYSGNSVAADSNADPVRPSEDLLKKAIATARPVDKERNKVDESIDEYVYVDHAGLVLLHPFLSTFFSNLKLLNAEEQFADESSQIRAVHLLSFLATGKMNPDETELPFCKFLTGWPLSAPIQKTLLLTENEVQECDQLLNAVISYWKELKNTSPDGLREGFLVRKGKIDLREEIPVLFVERRAQDILLEKLPWGIGFVQLPWLDKVFTTIWN